MAGIFPQEMPDERLGSISIPISAHERMLQLAGDPSHIEHPVPASHAFQVDCGHIHAGTEQEVCRSGVAVQPDLPVLPHLGPVAPPVAQPGKLVDVPLSYATL